MRVLTKTYRWLRRWGAVRRRFCAAKHRLLSSMALTKVSAAGINIILEHGWDNHQDVHAFAMQLPDGGLEPTP